MIRLPSKLLRQRSSVKSRPKRKHDERPALAVLEDAAACLGERGMGASTPEDAAAALEAHGVVWAWQLPHLSPEQWAAAGVAIGYQAAIQAVLSGEMGLAAEAAQPAECVPQQLRQFLLCLNDDGSPAKPMDTMSSMGLAMLCSQRGDIRSLCIAAGELMSVLCGLMIAIPLALYGSVAADDAADGVSAWNSAPRLAEWLDALCILAIILLLLAISGGWFTAHCVVLWGSTVPDTDLAFFEKSTRMLGSWWKARVRVRVPVFPDC